MADRVDDSQQPSAEAEKAAARPATDGGPVDPTTRPPAGPSRRKLRIGLGLLLLVIAVTVVGVPVVESLVDVAALALHVVLDEIVLVEPVLDVSLVLVVVHVIEDGFSLLGLCPNESVIAPSPSPFGAPEHAPCTRACLSGAKT